MAAAVGGGSAGLTAAKFAARFKKSVLLVEKARMGGDCTWTGCVPSKTLLSIAKTAHSARTASHGISVGEVKVDMKAVKARIDSVIDKIYTADDSPEALRALGIEVLSGTATFVDADTLSVDGQPIVANKGVVLATGAVSTLAGSGYGFANGVGEAPREDMVEAAAYSHPGGRGWTSPKAADATDTKPEEDLAEQEL